MATRQEIDNVIDATDMVALVSEYVRLEKAGKNYKGLCPFHNEDTPSFVVSAEKKLAHCFGCGGGGNPIKFLMDIENIDFASALNKLAKRNGVSITENTQFVDKKQNLTKYYKIMQVATNFYKKYLDNSSSGLEAKEYLNKRGLNDETIKVFNIGLSPKPGDTLYQILKESEFLELDINDVGLIEKGNKGYFDLFANRIMFPIYDEFNNPIGFSGRIFGDTDKKIAKYVNTRDTVLFRKSDVLFNINLAKPEILKNKRVVLYEGQMDVIASYKSGIKEAICTMGTALTISQARLLSKYTNNAVICYDGDKAGIAASLKAINVFRNAGFNVHLVLLPNGMDPDEFVLKNGEEAYKEYFESHLMDANQYIFEQAFINKNLNDSIVLEAVKSQIFDMLSNSSSTDKEVYLNKLSERINVSYESIIADFNRYYNSTAMPNFVDNNDDFIPNENYPYYEQTPKPIIPKNAWNHSCELRLFMYAKSSKEKALYIDNMISDRMDALSIENQSLWVTLINSFYENYAVFDEALFIKMLNEEEVKHYTNILDELRKFNINEYNDEDLHNCIAKLNEIKLVNANKQISSKVKNDMDLEDAKKLIEKKFANRRKQELLKNRRK
ncbi:MAG: DNA primase [Acholeplasmatales bacterium]|nr:DNA primase [Acholeplasmatales bacterium]